MRARRQPDNQQLRLRVAKSRHRLTPIRPVPIRKALFARNAFAILDKTRALSANNDFLVQQVQRTGFVIH